MNQKSIGFLKNFFWLFSLIVGAIFSVVIMYVIPQKIYIDSFFEPISKVFTFFLVICGIAFFPQLKKLNKYAHFLLMIMIISFLVYFIPRVSYYGFVGIPKNEPMCYDNFYLQLWLFLYPAIICTVCFAYRIMGGSAGNCIKLGLIPVIALFSGLLDIIWPITNRMPLPDVLQANHIRIFLGHWPTYREAVIFTFCHLPLVVIIMALPLNKWFDKISNRYLSK